MPRDLESIKSAIARVICGAEQGTAYLVSPTRLVTCYHVVSQGGAVAVTMGGAKLTAKVVFPTDDAEMALADAADTAVLELSQPVTATPFDVAPYGQEGRWRTYGFPALADGTGLPLEGSVLDSNGLDVNQQSAMVLYSDQIAAGMAAPVGGFSGSPVLVDGIVVGHLKRVLSERDKPGRPVLGLLFATPAKDIAKLANLTIAAVAAPAPPAGANLKGGRIFISYRSKVRQWARDLADAMEHRGIEVWLDQEQIKPGDVLANTIQQGLTNARGAVALITKEWLDSPWCQEEANALLQRDVEDKNFRLVPVLLEDVKLPAMWAGRIWIDFRGQSGPKGAALERLLLALSGENSPAMDAEKAVQSMIEEIQSAVTADRVYRLWTKLRRTSMVDNRVSEAAADVLIGFGRADYALEVIGTAGDGIRARQLRGLALAKTDRLEDAIEVLRKLEAETEDDMDSETGGILAGRYRQMWEKTNDPTWLINARDTYKKYFQKSNDPYCGINAASLALLDGDRPEARKLAGQLVSALENRQDLDRWNLATLGEANLILEDLDKAKEWYRRAAGAAAGRHQDIVVMRRTARKTLEAIQQPKNLLDKVLSVPAAVAFFGHSVDAPNRETPRFPVSQVRKVRDEIEAMLKTMRAGYGASSASAGSDLLFLVELLDMGGQATVVLPTDVDNFRETFLYGSWVDRFNDVVAKANVKVIQPNPKEDVWDACRREIRNIVCDRAKMLESDANLLVVWDGDSKNYVYRAIEYWEEEGDPITKIMLGNAAAAKQP
ncbi:MAG: DUF4071 domain-containing protein [Bryobacterales bacterium]|nr:DUF4071 domain-containing protein [Bryobacterales bacterium]